MPTTVNLQRRSLHGQWSNRLVFIGAVTAASVGLGNVWKFPQLLAAHGGGAFLLLYFTCVLMLTLPLMAAEMLLGRRGRANPVASYRHAANQAGRSSLWGVGGGLAILAGLLFLVGYSVLGGWSLAYVFRAGSGGLAGIDRIGAQELFRALTGDPERLLAWQTLFVVMTAMVVGRGVRHGLEEAVRWLWPALLILLGLLLSAAVSSGSFGQSAALLLVSRPEQIDLAALFAALSHAFYSFSVGLGVVLVFSAYLDDRVPILTTCGWIVTLDTVFSLLAGLVVVAFLSSTGQPVQGGLPLAFEVLPLVFGQLAQGGWVGTAFYLLLVLCAWTSAIALLEPAVVYLVERFRLDRQLATGYLAVAAWLLGVAALLSFNVWSHLRPLAGVELLAHSTVFDVLVFIASRLLLPVSALVLVVLVGWRMATETSRLELGGGADWRVWLLLLRFVTPFALLIIGGRALNLVG